MKVHDMLPMQVMKILLGNSFHTGDVDHVGVVDHSGDIEYAGDVNIHTKQLLVETY